MNYSFKMKDNEYWWGGSAVDGGQCPFDDKTVLERNFKRLCPNQTMPMLLSNQGRCIWSEDPFTLTISDGIIHIDGENVTIETFGTSLKDAYIGAMNRYFPPTGAKLPNDFFSAPQYNTWMQFTYDPTQEKVLGYAKDIIAHGYKPGIFIIDEGWQKDYGDWVFDRYKFPNPKEMIKQLHHMGFIVMLWVVPYVRPDGEKFIKSSQERFNPENYEKIFLRTDENKIALCHWWNGNSALLDMTKDCDKEYLDVQLQKLMKEYDVDGFKFDGGGFYAYSNVCIQNGQLPKTVSPKILNIAWNEFGARYQYHEYKDTFKGGGKRTIQRTLDRGHKWDGDGLSSLIPIAILQGLLGHPYICPDMIGGGEWSIRAFKKEVDGELFVRMAQCSALFPMMQFSWAPWEACFGENERHILAAHDIHIQFSETITKLCDDAYRTGEPILRSMEYNYPHMGYEKLQDTFMLGENILVSPVVKKGQTEKSLKLPDGKWLGFDGNVYQGGETVTYKAPLNILPYFIRQK